jgi:hypothetical protein
MRGKDLPIVIYQEVSNFGISSHKASSSSKLIGGGNKTVAAFNVGSLHLEKTKLSGSANRKLKKALSETRLYWEAYSNRAA